MRQKGNMTRQKYRRRKQQRGGFLNRYGFSYAGRDTVNQFGKIAPGLIKNASSEINNLAQQRINQIIRRGGQETERVLPKIIRGANEDVYQTPFTMLGKFEKQQLQKIKLKILNLYFFFYKIYNDCMYKDQTKILNIRLKIQSIVTVFLPKQF